MIEALQFTALKKQTKKKPMEDPGIVGGEGNKGITADSP